ncbi:MAG TPA: AMP-binding protein [Streptosporangiaceae bacterium]|nr:AMP-binding protein [Streptosporangiaceae bacterium]
MNTRDLMRRAAQMFAGRPALIHNDRRLTYAQAWQRATRLANGLTAMGLRPGDRVAVLEDNSIEAADFLLGTTLGGFVRVPLYARNSVASHVHMTRNAACRALVASAAYREQATAVRAALDLPVVLLRDEGYEGWLSQQNDTDPDPAIPEDDLYVVRHTGGTTGLPKGVAYTQRNWINGMRDWFYAYPVVEPGDVFMHVGPISHGSGYFFTPVWLHGGVNLLLDHFDAAEALATMERERVGYVFTVPTMAAAMTRVPDAKQHDFSHLKMFHISGAPVSDRTALDARELFGDVLYQMYGQTEAVTGTIMSGEIWFSDVPGSQPLRSAGRPFPFAEVRIVGPDGQPLATGLEGEIAIRCDGQMSGYLDDPEATSRKVIDGWVRTGDIGRLDANGFLYVLDRLDDMIISGGFNIYPTELENVIANHPAVTETAVFGVPDQRWGEAPIALCVVGDPAAVDPGEIIQLCAGALGSYKKPREVLFTSVPLPKSPTGKLQRKVLREEYWKSENRRVGGA